MTDGLIVRKPFAIRLVKGQKCSEFRRKPLPKNKINTPIYILNQGKILGTVIFMYSQEIRWKIYKWVVLPNGFEYFDPPKRYKHKNGAVIWIKDVEVID